MDNLPRIPKDWEKINKLYDKLSRSDLELLNSMDDFSRKWFFDSIKWQMENRKRSSDNERIRGVKFFFIVLGICALAAVTLLNGPMNELSILFRLFASFGIFAIAGNFIMIPIEAIKSAIQKTEFSLQEHLLSRNPTMEGVYLVSLFVFLLNDLF